MPIQPYNLEATLRKVTGGRSCGRPIPKMQTLMANNVTMKVNIKI